MYNETQPLRNNQTISLEKNELSLEKNIYVSSFICVSPTADLITSLNPPSTPSCFRENSTKDFSDIVPPTKEKCNSCNYVTVCKTRVDKLEFLEKNLSTIIQYEVYKSTKSDHY